MIASARCDLVHYGIAQKAAARRAICSTMFFARGVQCFMNEQHTNGLAKALSIILIVVIIGALLLSAFPV